MDQKIHMKQIFSLWHGWQVQGESSVRDEGDGGNRA